MSNEFLLNVNKREMVSKGQRKRLRKNGEIPGIFYSHDSKESIPFYIKYEELNKAQKADTRIFSINVGSKKRNVLFKAVQYHPVTDEILHIDLFGIKMDQVVIVNVPIQLTGTAIGATEGGIVVQTLNELEVECLPMDIPTSVEVNISELDIGDNLKVDDINLEDNITAKSGAEQIVVSITQAMKEEELIPQVEEDEEMLEGEEGIEEAADEGEGTAEVSKEEKSAEEDKKDKEG